MNDTETMTSSKRAEANRRNAQKSTGPRTAEGKARSRFNAVKHGMRAKADILPGEDPDAFQARVDRWTADLKPADEVETFLVGRAVRLSWQLERADRALAERDAEIAADRRAERADEVLALGRRLFWDPRGPLVSFPFRPEPGFLPHRVSWSGKVDDPDDPARLLVRLEATAIGCAWLLDCWAELRAVLEDGAAWQPPERFRAVRLLGRQPLDLLADGRVLTVYLAGATMGTAEAHEFADVVAELGGDEKERFVARLRQRIAARGRPADAEAGRAELLELVAAEEDRLEEVLAGHLAGSESAGESGGFDAGNEGERLRRYQQACDRGLLRVLEALRKRQRDRDRAGVGASAGGRPAAAAQPAADRAKESERRLLELMKLMGPEAFRKALLGANGAHGGPARNEGPPPPAAAATIEANEPIAAPESATIEANAPARPAGRIASAVAIAVLAMLAGLVAAGPDSSHPSPDPRRIDRLNDHPGQVLGAPDGWVAHGPGPIPHPPTGSDRIGPARVGERCRLLQRIGSGYSVVGQAFQPDSVPSGRSRSGSGWKA